VRKRAKTGSRQGVWGFVARVWLGIREWCGDAAYDRYLETQARHGSGAARLSREEFYVEQLQKRYSRVSRCC